MQTCTGRVVVIDNGSSSIKAGYAGEHAPRAVFPSVVGEPRNKGVVMATGDKEYYVGDIAREKRGCLGITRPIHGGHVVHWRDTERLWNHTLYNELRIAPENHPVLLTEPPLNPSKNRETTAEIMFEAFRVPGLYMAVSSVLSLYSSGETTGLVVESGKDTTLTVPIFEGYSLTRHTGQSRVAGQMVTDYLVRLLAEKGYDFTTENELDIVNYIKETICYVVPDFDDALSQAATTTSNVVKYPLPDGQDIVLNEERFKCTELLFDNTLMPMSQAKEVTEEGVDCMCFSSIGKCDAEIRNEMYRYVLLSGGNTLFQGTANRISQGLHRQYKNKFPNEPVVPMKVVDNVERMYATWLGGSMLGILQKFPAMCIDRSQYQEQGAAVVHSKCF